MSLILFCLIVTILLMIFSKKLIIKMFAFESYSHPDIRLPTAIFRVLLFITIIYLLKNCENRVINELSRKPDDQLFSSDTWQKDSGNTDSTGTAGMMRNTMLADLRERHSFLIDKSKSDIISILGKPDTNSYYINTDTILYWKSVNPMVLMGSVEPVIIYFKDKKSYKILIGGIEYTE